MTMLSLQATKRSVKANQTRAAEQIPAVVYGHGVETESIALPYMPFAKAYKQAGESTLLDLHIASETPRKVLIHDVQHDPITGRFIHVDFYAVQMAEKMKTKIPVHLVGEAPAVKQKGGLLVKSLSHLSVECLPSDLVHEVTIDITHLDTFGQSIYVKDIVPPKGIVILDKPQEPVVTVMRPKTEEELAKELAVESTEVKAEDAVKVVEKGKKEEDGEDGETAKAGAATAKGTEAKPATKSAKGGEDKKK